MNELQWRGMRGVGSGTSRLEVEAAWVGGSCPGRRSLCRGDVLYTTERQIASSPTRKPLARSPSLPFLSPPPLSSLFSLPSYSLSFSPFMRLVAIPPFARFGPPLRSSRCSLSVRCSSFLGPFILLGPPFRLSPFNRFFGASVCARSSRHESLRPRRTAYSYLAVLRRGSGYARRLRQRCRAVRSTKNSSATSRVAAVGRLVGLGRTAGRTIGLVCLLLCQLFGNYVDTVVVVYICICFPMSKLARECCRNKAFTTIE